MNPKTQETTYKRWYCFLPPSRPKNTSSTSAYTEVRTSRRLHSSPNLIPSSSSPSPAQGKFLPSFLHLYVIYCFGFVFIFEWYRIQLFLFFIFFWSSFLLSASLFSGWKQQYQTEHVRPYGTRSWRSRSPSPLSLTPSSFNYLIRRLLELTNWSLRDILLLFLISFIILCFISYQLYYSYHLLCYLFFFFPSSYPSHNL